MFLRFTQEQQQRIIEDIQRFFYNQRDEDISEFEAERVFDFVKESIAPYIYNVAIADAKYAVDRQYATIEEELEALERPIVRK
ncbi:DUF2164 domain-containing protein [Lysinibacillus piscis]|uniref:DUF2164 domain-containing protein n=1 Tax=Lysinibacillus piscis TaxID=2518931 RepID=A0ABQ5NJP5_9BACI|nr:DUF2164 domain-containing protein [Lysinibacillus sp. KH24]GLC88591.1 hypothetical protein LYSBPC_17180 [Lysinibacillus sp. KH24]